MLQQVVCNKLAASFLAGADVDVWEGEELLTGNYPAVHTVGRAAARPPLLLHIMWQPEGASEDLPLLALVGKGEP